MNKKFIDIEQQKMMGNKDHKDDFRTSASIEQNPMLSAVYVGGQTPIERLRNKLSPFLNLSAILNDNGDLVMPFVENTEKNKTLNTLFEKELENCKSNIEDIYKYLFDCEKFYNRR